MDRSDLIASLRENSPRDRIITAVDVPDIDSAIEAEAQAQAICMQTKDYGRAYHAFVAKQKPVFEGN